MPLPNITREELIAQVNALQHKVAGWMKRGSSSETRSKPCRTARAGIPDRKHPGSTPDGRKGMFPLEARLISSPINIASLYQAFACF